MKNSIISALLVFLFFASCTNNGDHPVSNRMVEINSPDTEDNRIKLSHEFSENSNETPIIKSYDFINNMEADNFYFKKYLNKTITLSNLIVYNYIINDNTTILKCMSYSPEAKKLIPFTTDNAGDEVNCIIGKDTIKEREANGRALDRYIFEIKLSYEEDVKKISFYSGSDTYGEIKGLFAHHLKGERDGKDEYIIIVAQDVINVTGTISERNLTMIPSITLSNCRFIVTKSYLKR